MRHAHQPRPTREGSALSQLAAVNQVLSKGLAPQARLTAVVDKLALQDELLDAVIVIMRRDTGELVVDATHQSPAAPPVRYDAAHDVTRKVVETGQAVVLSQVGADGNVTFVCVPINFEDEVVGVLRVDRPKSASMAVADAVQFYSVVATMMGPTASARQARLEASTNEQSNPTHITARASAMDPVFELIDAVAPSDATVLIRGESGTGKELVADAIHRLSRRRDGPFVKVNCAALANGVLESELFGHEAGAFTGAMQRRIGRFEAAMGGTIFLDEIGDFSPSVQVTLLRILQQQTFERVGGSETLCADVRVVAATNRDLESLMAEDRFRQDLYYRLNVFPIHVPPLRDRRSDILLLADTFVGRFSKAFKKDVRRITSEAIDLLTAYHWPGNVRELENCIERATLLTQDGVIHVHHLPPTLQTASSSKTETKNTLSASLGAFERELLVDALKDTRGNLAQAALRLGVTERQMGMRIRKYGLTPDIYTTPSDVRPG